MGRAKSALRKSIAALSCSLDKDRVMEESRSICRRMTHERWWPCSGAVMVYIPAANEPDIAEFIHACVGARIDVVAPRIDWEARRLDPALIADPATDFTPSRHGIREPGSWCPPAALRSIDVVLVPGVAFGERGERLGRGGGFYDRFLARGELRALRVGIAFDFQVVPDIPADAHDVRMDAVVTPSRVIRATGRA
ncbi:MAG TPA: 5-formyltetrahydrofolate cyclo-ligase [Phycisphaerales bacterium]|nr:5-formyltetrahydrofolate cyclo-ligase [Phycisphaerales bacterium]